MVFVNRNWRPRLPNYEVWPTTRRNWLRMRRMMPVKHVLEERSYVFALSTLDTKLTYTKQSCRTRIPIHDHNLETALHISSTQDTATPRPSGGGQVLTPSFIITTVATTSSDYISRDPIFTLSSSIRNEDLWKRRVAKRLVDTRRPEFYPRTTMNLPNGIPAPGIQD